MKPSESELLARGVAEVIDRSHLQKRLEQGEVLRVKFGIDPNKPDLHLGHAVALRKLAAFQEVGHAVVIILGDYTAQLGDPSDRSGARQLISAAETKVNAELVLKQVGKILDLAKTEVHRNSEWFSKLDLRGVIELMARTTLNQLLAHETFQKRLDDQLPLHTQEILYPIMQGYDSVMVKADLELGGLDQKFNLLIGRAIQRAFGQREQDIMLFPYLPGLDGAAKMSKSLDNTINLTDNATTMYGKTMTLSDALIIEYFELATLVPSDAITLLMTELGSARTNPRDVKMQLASAITALYHGRKAASEAEAAFIAQFQKGQRPDDIKDKKMATAYKTAILMVSATGLVASNAEARRAIEQGGVRLDDQILANALAPVKLKKGMIVQVGKRRYVRVK